MSKIAGKIKTGAKQLLDPEKGWKKIFRDFIIGFIVGTLADLILCYIWTEHLPAGSNVEVGFSIYYRHPDATAISGDDLLLMISSAILLITKRFWFVIGYTLGWYISSNENLYGAVVTPFLHPEG